MPNKNYEKGRRKEYKVINDARRNNANVISFRSAGSHSPIDCVIIDVIARTIRFVQCKPDSMSQNKKNLLLAENNLLNGSFFCKFEVL